MADHVHDRVCKLWGCFVTANHEHDFSNLEQHSDAAGCGTKQMCKVEGCREIHATTRRHTWDDAHICTKCKYHEHTWKTIKTLSDDKQYCQWMQDVCTTCPYTHTKEKVDHVFVGPMCGVCLYKRPCDNHVLVSQGWKKKDNETCIESFKCMSCFEESNVETLHNYESGTCTKCQLPCSHNWEVVKNGRYDWHPILLNSENCSQIKRCTICLVQSTHISPHCSRGKLFQCCGTCSHNMWIHQQNNGLYYWPSSRNPETSCNKVYQCDECGWCKTTPDTAHKWEYTDKGLAHCVLCARVSSTFCQGGIHNLKLVTSTTEDNCILGIVCDRCEFCVGKMERPHLFDLDKCVYCSYKKPCSVHLYKQGECTLEL